MAKWILGLTGGIGAGKTAISDELARFGIEIVDADVIARQVVQPGSVGLRQIAAHFGKAILLADGSLDRAQLRAIIFADAAQKTWLNNLLHPLIRTQILEALAHSQSAYVVLSAPLLFENKLQTLCNHTLLVDVPVELQLARTTQRDGVTSEQVEQIIAAQMPREQKRALADDILDNSGALADTLAKLKQYHQGYLLKAQQQR
ncbi:dephospho-CoA kinase [Pseudoalteromonas fenneropenaei]|uniref:Dephospho-CoA kinase n=1 Tax=Pseudoalteromonas fenneropenaei TaxID=1737459 RepID=A0ABV7CLE8_9GAMM